MSFWLGSRVVILLCVHSNSQSNDGRAFFCPWSAWHCRRILCQQMEISEQHSFDDKIDMSFFPTIDNAVYTVKIDFFNKKFAWSQSAIAYRVHYKVLSTQAQVKIRLLATNLNHLKKGRKKETWRRGKESDEWDRGRPFAKGLSWNDEDNALFVEAGEKKQRKKKGNVREKKKGSC